MKGYSATSIVYSFIIALVLLLLLATRLRPPQLAFFVAFLAFFVILYVFNQLAYLMRRRPVRTDVKHIVRQSEELVSEIGRLARDPSFARNPRPEVREATARIHAVLGQIVQAIKADENKRDAAELVLLGYITPTRDILRQYVKLSSRGVEMARGELAATESELPAIEARLKRLYNHIHEEDIVNLSVLNDMVEESRLVDDVSTQDSVAPRE